MREQICYKSNCIREAVIRLDFLTPIKGLEEALNTALSAPIKDRFPILEPRERIVTSFKLGPGIAQAGTEQKKTEWRFHGTNRDKHLSITDRYIVMVHRKYTSFEDFISEYMSIVTALFGMTESLQVSRFGLRYINEITLNEEGDPTDWSSYLNPNLLTIFNVAQQRQRIARAFHNLELNYDQFLMRFQYGMNNPDYPALIKKKSFILDLDTFSQGLVNKADLNELAKQFHSAIQDQFELSISDGLRLKLNKE